MKKAVSADSNKKKLLLSLAALGVVYGDIGTSPLYAINEMFFGHVRAHIARQDVVGGISLVVWLLTIIISFKYIMLVLKADNDGEGGVFALFSLINKLSIPSKVAIGGLLIIAAGLLFGDGMITPAISVISAIEGISVATQAMRPYIIPLTILILTALFLIQKKGTSSVGKLFGPVIIVWFLVIGGLGVVQIVKQPVILAAFNPLYALNFLVGNDIKTILFTLGAVMLVVTGGEALYADMGHFGSFPIRFSWFGLVYPALLLNYLGQGAYLVSGQTIIGKNIFFSMVSPIFLFPMVILATAATVIASQALISGAYSLASQAVSLGLFPYFKVVHTNYEHEGQIYVPFINWALLLGCILLVLIFRSSDRLASAYGLAVSGVMLVTTIAMFAVARNIWNWSNYKTALVFGPIMGVEALMLSANSLKFIEGGYIPVFVGVVVFVIITTWQWGRRHVIQSYESYPSMGMAELVRLKHSSKVFLPRSIIIMTPKAITSLSQSVPTLKQIFWERYGMLPKHLIFLTVNIKKVPHIHKDRFEVSRLYNSEKRGSITAVKVNFGFMEDPNVEKILVNLAKHREINVDRDHNKWLIHVLHERVYAGKFRSLREHLRYTIFNLLQKNSETADKYFGLGKERNLSIEVLPVMIPSQGLGTIKRSDEGLISLAGS